jgi:GMP synthase-like glutamine amidotransferase
MKPVLVSTHGHNIPPGYLGDVLAEAATPVLNVPLWAGAALPSLDDVSAVVVLGGKMGAYEDSTYPYLRDEKDLIREAARREMPVLGVCLGGQLAAAALGGRAFLAPQAEVDVIDVSLTDAGKADPVAQHLSGPVLVWHQDTWELPADAVELGRSEHYPMAFRLGSVLGIQPHPEASPEIAKGWAEAHPQWLADRGLDAGELMGRLEEQRDASRRAAEAFFGAWVNELA